MAGSGYACVIYIQIHNLYGVCLYGEGPVTGSGYV